MPKFVKIDQSVVDIYRDFSVRHVGFLKARSQQPVSTMLLGVACLRGAGEQGAEDSKQDTRHHLHRDAEHPEVDGPRRVGHELVRVEPVPDAVVGTHTSGVAGRISRPSNVKYRRVQQQQRRWRPSQLRKLGRPAPRCRLSSRHFTSAVAFYDPRKLCRRFPCQIG